MALLLLFIFILGFLLYLLIDLFRMGNINDFIDKKILRRFLWLWLPFYALWRLTKEVLKKK